MKSAAEQTRTKTSARERLAATLKGAREHKKLSRNRVAKELTVPVDTIQILENPTRDDIPLTHIVGLSRQYAALLGIDPDVIDQHLEDLDVVQPSGLMPRR